MNNQANGGILWTQYTWNPVTGCKHGCDYCYAAAMSKRLGRSFEPEYHPNRLAEPLKEKKPCRIFVGSMADLFGAWVPREWIDAVLATVRKAPQHTFQFLTKNPKRLAEFNPWPANAWVGASIDIRPRLELTLKALSLVDAPVRFVSFEPLNADMGSPDVSGILEWLIVGAQTGKGAHQPLASWVLALIDAADRAGIALLMKDNLVWQPRREEFPHGRERVGHSARGYVAQDTLAQAALF